MWNEPSIERLAKIPRLYETEHTQIQDKLIYLHFFIGGCDWFIAEFDQVDTFFGFAILNNDLQNAEWDYVSFTELKAVKINEFVEVDCEGESVWRVCKASEVEKIRIAHGWAESSPKKESKRKIIIRGDALMCFRGTDVPKFKEQLESGQMGISEMKEQLFITEIDERCHEILEYYDVDANSPDEISEFLLEIFALQRQRN